MANSKRLVGFFFGLIVAVILWNIKIPGLSIEGQKCLAISLMTVIWWATKINKPGFTALIMLVCFVLFNIAPADIIFSLWTKHLMYLIIGGYLIAAAVEESGLGKRIAYMFVLKFVVSYRSIIISGYVLGLILSLIIPHPWPRSFLIMSIMTIIIKNANLTKRDGANVGLSVFAGAVPVSMIFFTGDSLINVAAVSMSGQNLTWLGWLKYMGLPGLTASLLTCLLQLMIFKPENKLMIDKTELQKQLYELGALTTKEKKLMFLLIIAFFFWATQSIHQIEIGWVTITIALAMSLPIIGDVMPPSSFHRVPLNILLFMTAAVAIGRVGGITGMNEWVTSIILPSQVPANPFIFAAIVTGIAICLHMTLGSVLAVMGIAIPTLISYGNAAGLNPLVPTLLVYTAIGMHWILPFHHMNILVGLGDNGGMYNEYDAAKLGIPLTAVVFIITVMVQVPWWKITGLI